MPKVKLNFGPRMERFALRPPERDAKINLSIGSVRSGKTWGLHPKIMYLCDYAVGGRRLITGVSKDSIYTNVLTDLFDIVGSKNYHYNKQSGILNLLGCEWKVMGAKDEGSEKYIRGATIGAAVCDEVVLMPKSYFQMLLSRLSPPGSRLYGTTNTDSPYHWLYTDYLQNEELLNDGLLWSETFTMDDNPNLDPEYVESQKKLYKGVFYKRFIEGLWVMAQGAIYGDSWTDGNKYTDADIHPGLFNQGGYQEHIIAIDYGTTNPMVFLDGADDGETLWWDNEYYWDSKKERRQKTDPEYADDLEKFVGESRFKARGGVKVIVDPSAASFRLELVKRGFWVVGADNDVDSGIKVVSSALAQNKIRFHATRCPNSVREHQSYSWNEKAAIRGVEEPLKTNDHSCDAGRYGAKDIFKIWRLEN